MNFRPASLSILIFLSLILSSCSKQLTGNTNANTSNPTTPSNTNKNVATSITPTSNGQLVKFEGAGVQMEVPGAFKVEKEGEDILVTTGADNLTNIYFHISADDNWEKAFENAPTELDRYIKNTKVTRTDKEKDKFVDFMWSKGMQGTGVDKNGKPVEWNLQVYDAPKRPLISVSYGDPKTDATAIFSNLFKMIKSFKKI